MDFIVSIIIPVYNGAKYIKRCIESISKLHTDCVEAIVVDDGSLDETWIVCEEMAKKYAWLKIFRKENGGVGSARNFGILKSTGRWIGFVDADDWISEDWFSVVSSSIDSTVDLLEYGYFRVDENLNQKKYSCSSTVYKNSSKFISSADFKHTVWSYLFQAKIIKENHILFPEKIKYSEDYCFIVKYLCFAEVIKCISNNVYFYFENFFSAVAKDITEQWACANLEAALDFCSFVFLEKNKKDYEQKVVLNFVLDYFYYYSKIPKGHAGNMRIFYDEFLKKYQEKTNCKIDKKLISFQWMNLKIILFVRKWIGIRARLKRKILQKVGP